MSRLYMAWTGGLVAVLFSLAAAAETSQMNSDCQEDCAVNARNECAERCLVEHNCCIKSCNWVEPKAKSKCLEHCESILMKCHQECDKKPEVDESP